MSEISEVKMHHLICAFCDNPKCVRGTEKCEFEQWKKQQAESEVELVIKISEVIYKRILLYKDLPVISNLANDYPELMHAVANGTPLPKGHGAIKDVSQIEIPMCEDRAYEKWVQVAINSAPTIIESDRSETNHGST